MPREVNHDRAWSNFARRHRGSRFLDCDPLYALPVKIINAINSTARLSFLT